MDSSRRQQPLGIPRSTSTNPPNPPSTSSGPSSRRRKNHRGGKKKKTRRKSFAIPADEGAQDSVNSEGPDDTEQGFYSRPGRNLSTTSLESEALLDHRYGHPRLRPDSQQEKLTVQDPETSTHSCGPGAPPC